MPLRRGIEGVPGGATILGRVTRGVLERVLRDLRESPGTPAGVVALAVILALDCARRCHGPARVGARVAAARRAARGGDRDGDRRSTRRQGRPGRARGLCGVRRLVLSHHPVGGCPGGCMVRRQQDPGLLHGLCAVRDPLVERAPRSGSAGCLLARRHRNRPLGASLRLPGRPTHAWLPRVASGRSDLVFERELRALP